LDFLFSLTGHILNIDNHRRSECFLRLMLAFAFLVLLRILKKSLERASQEGAEKTTEMKERIKAKIDLVDMVRNSPLVCLL